MKYVKSNNTLLVIGAIIILLLGVLIGASIKKENNVFKESENKISVNNYKEEINKTTVPEENIEKIEEIPKEDNIQSDINSNKNNNNNISKNNESIEIPKEDVYSNKDILVINKMEEALDNIKTSKNDNDFKSSAKGVFICIVDFLFYDGKINGVTFQELTDKGKEQVLKLANKIDASIEKRIPGYKETISKTATKALNKASELIKKGANNINDFAKEKLGDENYQSLIEAKDELVKYTKNAFKLIGKVGGNLINSTKDKLDKWYQDFKNKN